MKKRNRKGNGNFLWNLRSFFGDWLKTAVAGIIFLGVLGIIGFVIGG